jgi:hypothetical protein
MTRTSKPLTLYFLVELAAISDASQIFVQLIFVLFFRRDA